MKIDNVAMNYVKSLQGSISAQLRKADIDQQAIASAMQEMHQLQEIAQLIGDEQTAQKIQDIATSQIDMMKSFSPEMSAAFRQFYNSMDVPEQPAEEESGEEVAEK